MNKQRWGGNTRQNDLTDGRATILAAAKFCYGQKGMSSTTIDDIAKQAQVSRRTIYRYFDNKKAIIQALVDEESGDFLTLMKAHTQSPSLSFLQQLQCYVVYMIRNGEQAPGYSVLLGKENSRVTGQYYNSSKSNYSILTELIKAPFEAAQTAGEVRNDINYHQLISWMGRIVFSYSQMAATDNNIDDEIARFFIPALLPQ